MKKNQHGQIIAKVGRHTDGDVHHNQIQYPFSSLACTRLKTETTHWTAGDTSANENIVKPAARTATAWNSPDEKRMLRGIASIAALPMSRSKKKNHSKDLKQHQVFISPKSQETYVNKAVTASRNHVW